MVGNLGKDCILSILLKLHYDCSDIYADGSNSHRLFASLLQQLGVQNGVFYPHGDGQLSDAFIFGHYHVRTDRSAGAKIWQEIAAREYADVRTTRHF
jgi:hypothetical protein